MNDRSPENRGSVDAMRSHWRRFARENAMYYVATNREEWRPEDFYEAGREFIDGAVEWAGPQLGRDVAVEIGCGAGRMLVHLARHFAKVEGFDIAPEMIEEGRSHGLPANISMTVSSGADLSPLPDASADFVLSAHVFQHIPDSAVVADYIAETGRVLRARGRAVLHFDTREETVARRWMMRLPDGLLPRDRRRFIRRYPLPGDWPAAVAQSSGLTVVGERGRGTLEHFVLLGQD